LRRGGFHKPIDQSLCMLRWLACGADNQGECLRQRPTAWLGW
jgi:hypothetical protein